MTVVIDGSIFYDVHDAGFVVLKCWLSCLLGLVHVCLFYSVLKWPNVHRDIFTERANEERCNHFCVCLVMRYNATPAANLRHQLLLCSLSDGAVGSRRTTSHMSQK